MSFSETSEQIEQKIAKFEALVRSLEREYAVGDRVECAGEVMIVASLQEEVVAGYWLRGEAGTEVFVALDYAANLISDSASRGHFAPKAREVDTRLWEH